MELAVSRILAEQHELEFVELHPASVDAPAALMLPTVLARRYRAVPIRFIEDGSLLVAVADPTTVVFSDELRLAVGMPVRICVAAPEAIEVTIAKLIDVESRPLDEIVPEITEDEGDARILDLRLDTPAVVFADRGDADDRRDRAARGRDHTRNRGNRSLAGYGDNPRGRRAAGRRGLTTLDEVRRVAGETLD